jgi:hypothetical protein
MPLSRNDLELRYRVFDKFALNDQRSYYDSVSRKHRKAATQVNRLRALLGVLTGVAAAAAALMVATSFGSTGHCTLNPEIPYCATNQLIVNALTILAIVFPAFAAMFNTLADLYQWNRLITIYRDASENIELADAQSPDEHLSDETRFRAALMAYAEGTLSVMSDETAQWGQAIRTPPQLEAYLQTAEKRSDAAARSLVAQRAGTSTSGTTPTSAG